MGDRGGPSRDSPGRPLSFRPGHGDGARERSRHSVRPDPLSRGGHKSHGLLPRVRAATERRELSRPLSKTPPGLSRGPAAEARALHALPQQGAVRDAFAARLFRHRELSEHFAEYTPWFIKRGREDLIEKFGIPLDEYPKRCVEQIEGWKRLAETYRSEEKIEVRKSREYASAIVNSVWTGEPSLIYGNQRNDGSISSLPDDCAVEVACLVDALGIHPTRVGALPPQLTALIRTNVNVQELTVRALMTENREHIYHAAMMDPHTASELDLDQIWRLIDELITAHGDWLPAWAR